MKRKQTNSLVFSFSFKHPINENEVGGFSTWFQHNVFGWFLKSTSPQNLFGNFAGPQPKKVENHCVTAC